MKSASALLALFSLLIVAAVTWWEWTYHSSPGPLDPPHNIVPGLQGPDGCALCHGTSLQASMVNACAECHGAIRNQIESRQGLHGILDPKLAESCGKCHAEHNDGHPRLVTDNSFKLSGFPTRETFDHSKVTRYTLTGKHNQLRCDQCHRDASAPELLPAHKRFLGLSQQCTSCHTDVHKGTYGNDCAACHGQSQPFKDAPGFHHTDQFPLTQAHAVKDCATCHKPDGPTSVVALFKTNLTVRACTACHNDPHQGTFGADCASCHGTAKKFDQVPFFKHAAVFPLTGGHSNLACKQCHAPSGTYSVASLTAHPLPSRSCQDCHASPHKQSVLTFVSTATHLTPGQSCGACHAFETNSFLSPAATMTPQQHSATGFSLDPPHDKVACEQCHKDLGKRKPLVASPQLTSRFQKFFPGRSSEACESCHTDPHRGQFANSLGNGACLICHAATHFTPSTFDTARHDKTAFPLTGAHRAVACAGCHKPKDNFIRFVSAPTECSACHADVHKGRFDANPALATVNGRTGCERCHTTSSFTAFNWTAKDHTTWTGYPLNAAHASVACTDCHKPQRTPNSRTAHFGQATKTCAACHTDVHANQFAVANATDCARCHSDRAAKFTPTTFDHQRDSTYKLDPTHIKLACNACHRPAQIAPGLTAIRYRPLGTRCQDCHGSAIPRAKESR